MYGSLALTGDGHGTPDAILMGVEGEAPESVETSTIKSRVQDIHTNKSLRINGTHRIHFDPEKHLIFNYFQTLPQHPNGLRFCAYDKDTNLIATNEYFSIGGGFVVNDKTQMDHGENVYYKQDFNEEASLADRQQQDIAVAALPFKNAQELLEVCRRENMTIAQVVFENELKWRSAEEIRDRLLKIWNTMDESIRNGVMASTQGKTEVFDSFIYIILVKLTHGVVVWQLTSLVSSRSSVELRDFITSCSKVSMALSRLSSTLTPKLPPTPALFPIYQAILLVIANRHFHCQCCLSVSESGSFYLPSIIFPCTLSLSMRRMLVAVVS
jgi:Serine dehydratase beta chain/Serine dehydratase alpha chain